jgi:hypothetical protein
MSQFWQNLHARLQPAVPNERIEVPGIEMVERLLLHRVDAESRRAAVGGEYHAAAFHLAHEAQPALALVQLAIAGAQIALHAAVRQRVPPLARVVHSFHFTTR